jgi:hypothetical protein
MSRSIISHKLVKTRKTHQCWGCTKEFPSGFMALIKLFTLVTEMEE